MWTYSRIKCEICILYLKLVDDNFYESFLYVDSFYIELQNKAFYHKWEWVGEGEEKDRGLLVTCNSDIPTLCQWDACPGASNPLISQCFGCHGVWIYTQHVKSVTFSFPRCAELGKKPHNKVVITFLISNMLFEVSSCLDCTYFSLFFSRHFKGCHQTMTTLTYAFSTF